MYVDYIFCVNFCIRCEVGQGSYFFAYGCPIALIRLVEKVILFFLHWIAFASLSKFSWAYLFGSISEFCSIDLCLSLCQLIAVGDSFHSLLFYQYCFSYFKACAFPYKFYNKLTFVYQKTYCNFDKNCIKPIDQSGENWHSLCLVFQSTDMVSHSIYLAYDYWVCT